MSENIVNGGWGVVNDEDKSLQVGEYGHFGLNQRAFLTQFEFSDKAGKDGSDREAVLIAVTVGEKEYKTRIFDVTDKVYYKNKLIGPGEEGFEETVIRDRKQNSATVIHFLKSVGVTQAQIESVFTSPVSGFKEWATRLVSLLPSNFNKIPVDIFLQYQYTLREGQTQTYLELPRNLKDGKFIVPAENGNFKEVIDSVGLKYVSENNTVHTITKTAKFMESNKAKKQTGGEEVATAKVSIGSNTKGTW